LNLFFFFFFKKVDSQVMFHHPMTSLENQLLEKKFGERSISQNQIHDKF